MASQRPHALLRLTVDLVIQTLRDGQLQVLLIRRGNEPYRGQWALPGGFVRPDEDLDAAAARELSEETGIDSETFHLEQFAVFGAPDRDPRGRVVTVAYLAIAPNLPAPVAGSDASQAAWWPVDKILEQPEELAFDHADILRRGLERARRQLEYTTLATAFCAEEFTIGELRRVYEVVWGVPVDPRNFNRKVMRTAGFVVPTNRKRTAEAGRPAALYRKGDATTLYPPMLRSRLNQASD